MKDVVCPHCGAQATFIASVPKDAVLVMPCPSCYEYVLVFRSKVVALKKRVFEHGSREEKRAHIAEIVESILDDLLSAGAAAGLMSLPGGLQDQLPNPGGIVPNRPPISSEEVDRFNRIELGRIDNAGYFRKHLG